MKPIWANEVKVQVHHLAKHGLKPVPLDAPKNEVWLTVSIAPDGTIAHVETVKKSKYAFMNKAAIETFEKVATVLPPPNSCVHDGHCDIKWKFVLED